MDEGTNIVAERSKHALLRVRCADDAVPALSRLDAEAPAS